MNKLLQKLPVSSLKKGTVDYLYFDASICYISFIDVIDMFIYILWCKVTIIQLDKIIIHKDSWNDHNINSDNKKNETIIPQLYHLWSPVL